MVDTGYMAVVRNGFTVVCGDGLYRDGDGLYTYRNRLKEWQWSILYKSKNRLYITSVGMDCERIRMI